MATTPQAGERNVQMQVMLLSGGADSSWGQPNVDPRTPGPKLWGKLLHKSGMATISGDQEAAVTRASFRGNFRIDIPATAELWLGTVRYKITNVMPDYVAKRYTDYALEVINVTGPA